MSFSIDTVQIMIHRAGFRSEVSGVKGRRLEASHFDHNWRHSWYDDPSNGLMLLPEEHYLYHFNGYNHPEEIGLSQEFNRQALDSIWGRRLKPKDRRCLPPPEDAGMYYIGGLPKVRKEGVY